MTNDFMHYVLDKCGIDAQWYEDKSSPTGYSWVYFVRRPNFKRELNMISRETAMDIAFDYIISHAAEYIATKNIVNSGGTF